MKIKLRSKHSRLCFMCLRTPDYSVCCQVYWCAVEFFSSATQRVPLIQQEKQNQSARDLSASTYPPDASHLIANSRDRDHLSKSLFPESALFFTHHMKLLLFRYSDVVSKTVIILSSLYRSPCVKPPSHGNDPMLIFFTVSALGQCPFSRSGGEAHILLEQIIQLMQQPVFWCMGITSRFVLSYLLAAGDWNIITLKNIKLMLQPS